MYNKQVRWYIKPSFDGIVTQQYWYQKLLESDNYCWNYRWWLGSILFWDTMYIKNTRSTGTVHTSAKAHLTSIAISVSPSGETVRDRHQNLTICSWPVANLLQISCKSIREFLRSY